MSSKRVAFDEQELESRKKARTEDDGGEEGYDENEEDEDAPEDDLEQGTSKNRRFRMEGYESDDSDSKPSKKKGDEDDMFGDEEEVVDKKKKDKKEVKFLQKGDIEGQEWESGGVEYEEDGTKIEPFNMDEELEEGAFDEAGMYIRKKDEFAHHDNWLQGTSKEDIEKAREAHERQEERARADNATTQERNKAVNQTDLWKHLLTLLKPGENILAGLRRLGGTKPGAKKLSWTEKKKAKQAAEAAEASDPAVKRKRLEMEAITAIADKMMAFGVFNVYEDTYEQIIRKLRIDEAIDEFWEPGQDPPAKGLLEAIPELARVAELSQSGNEESKSEKA